tara:strand:- start:532 stop:990 length:459 start_codon:yes stop_codon:yes gene_type:complete
MKDTILETKKYARYHYVKVDNMEEFRYNFLSEHSFLKDPNINAIGIFKKHSYTDWKNIKEGDIVTVKDDYVYEKPTQNGYVHTNKMKVGKWKVTSWDMSKRGMGTWKAKFYTPTMSGVKLKLRVTNIETGMSNVLQMHEVAKVKKLSEIFPK